MSTSPPNTGLPRVVVLTSPGLFGAIIMNVLATHPGIELVGIGLTNRGFKGQGPWGTLKTFYRKCGWRFTWYGLVLSPIAWILLRLMGKPSCLRALGSQVRPLDEVNAAESISWLQSLSPDYVASYYFNQWIGPDVRKAAAKACVNVHPSLLPALRGPDPVFRALERGLITTGITIHVVEDGFDTGHVLCQVPVAVPPGSTHFNLQHRVIEDGARLLADWIASGGVPSAPIEPPPLADYSSFPTRADVKGFFRSGHRLFRDRDFWRLLFRVP